MALVHGHDGQVQALKYFLNKDFSEDQKLRLFINDITPDRATVAADLTEMSTLGYAAKDLAGANWAVAAGATESDPAQASYAQQVFTFEAGDTVPVYGYYVQGAVTGKLLWVERFTDGPYPIANLGDQIKITPKFTQGGVV